MPLLCSAAQFSFSLMGNVHVYHNTTGEIGLETLYSPQKSFPIHVGKLVSTELNTYLNTVSLLLIANNLIGNNQVNVVFER